MRELKGEISEVMLFCRSHLVPGQILALGVKIGDSDKKELHIVYNEADEKKESLANEVRGKLRADFGYASHWSKVSENEMIGLDERVKGVCREVVQAILSDIGERYLASVSPQVIQLIFPSETKIQTVSRNKEKSVRVVNTSLVYYTVDGQVVYAWNVPSVDAKMKSSSDGTIFATLRDWKNGVVYKVHTFEERMIVDMRFTVMENGWGVISVKFADMSRSTFTMYVDENGRLKPTHTPTVVKPAVKSLIKGQKVQIPAFVN